MERQYATNKFALIVAVLVACVNGLIYIFIVPPWQHYDEPNHFEYAWLIANTGHIPDRQDYDREMRRAVAESMVRHGFFRDTDYLPDLEAEKPYIGTYTQITDPPGYYLMVALPLFLSRELAIDTQLYIARGVSLLLFIGVIIIAWYISFELFGKNRLYTLLLPVFLALLPAFVDLMTAVNNDVGAVFAFSLFCLFLLRLYNRGFNWWRILGLVFTVVLSLYIKLILFLELPIITIYLLILALKKYGNRAIALFFGFVFVIALGFIIFAWRGDAAYWYRATSQPEPLVAQSVEAVEGKQVLALSLAAPATPQWIPHIYQPLPEWTYRALVGKQLTLGFWVWADTPFKSEGITLYQGSLSFTRMLDIDTSPQFFTIPVQLSLEPGRLWLSYRPPKSSDLTGKVYFDGVVLAEGSFQGTQTPDYQGNVWGDIPFENLVRNGGFEQVWFFIPPWLDDLGPRTLPDNMRFSSLVAPLLDFEGGWWYLKSASARMFRTFWAKFGWGHVPLLGHKPYRWLLGFTIFAFFGLGWSVVRKIRTIDWYLVVILGIPIFLFGLSAVTRGAIYIGYPRLYLPVGRYLYPVVILMSALLSYGWVSLLRLIRLSERWRAGCIILGMLYLNIYAIISIISYYQVGT